MSTAVEARSQSHILLHLIELQGRPLSAAVAEWILSLRLTSEQEERYHELLDRGNAGILTSAQRTELGDLSDVGMLLGLMHAKALAFLQADDS